MIEQILELHREYQQRFHTDPVFHARARLAHNVLAELQNVDKLDPQIDGGYAGYILAAALDKFEPARMNEPPIIPGCTRFYPEGGGYLDIPTHLLPSFRKG